MRQPMENRYQKGKEGERLAAEFLEAKGCELVARNFRCRLGEIDLVVRDGKTIVFVEVKSRKGRRHGLPQEAVSRVKQRRLTLLARWYLKENRLERHSARFDVIAITWEDQSPDVKWIVNAFEACD